MSKILIVEDEKNIARFMKLELQHEGFDVEVCENGRIGLETALNAQNAQFDCVLLDVMLPELNGIEVCRRIRMQSNVPVILITARDAVMDRVAGLDAGADDYVVKPFVIEELLARIRSVLRRVQKTSTKLRFKKITLDDEAYEVLLNEEKVDLTKTEYDLLKYLMVHKNKVCPREQIIENVWGYDSEIETNVVDVYIRHLRTKLKQDEPIIETVRGVGYVMRE